LEKIHKKIKFILKILDFLLYIYIREMDLLYKYTIMIHSTLTTDDRRSTHAKEVKRIMDYFIKRGDLVEFAKHKGYEYKVGDMKCIVNAHQNIPANETQAGMEAIIIELANENHSLLTAEYDTILYIDTTNRKRDKFYIIDVKKVYPAIQAGLAKKPTILPNGRSYKHFFPHRNNNVISNSGYRVCITEAVFKDLPGVTPINL
jgi:hypothetical protein